MADHDNFGSFIIGFIVGGIAGAIATILYAPKSGEETRQIIRNKKDEFVEKANVSMDEVYKQAEIVAKDAKDLMDDIASTTKSHANEITKKGKESLEEGKELFKKSVKKVADEADLEIPTSNE